MSLISDALKKAQQERDSQDIQDIHPDGEELPPEPPRNKPRIPKRLIIYSSLFLVILVSVLLVTVFYKPKATSQMKAMNIRPNQTPATQPQTQPRQQPQQQQQPQLQPQPQTKNEQKEPVTKAAKHPETDISKKTQPNETTPPPETVIVKKKPDPKPPVKKVKKAESTPPPVPKPRKKTVTRKPPPKKVETQKESPSLSNVETLIREGDRLFSEKKPEPAIEEYKKALKIKKTVAVYLKLYASFKAIKNPVLARAYVSDGLAHFPEDFYLNKIFSILNIREKKYREALSSANTAVSQNDGDYTLFTYRGLCYFHLKDYGNALVNFQESLQLNSDAVENYYYIGLIFDNRRQYDKALHYYNAFFKLNPRSRNFKHHKWVTRRIKLLEQYISR
ncbi:MAG: hypothetical protein GY940_20105 [bacterium]|nr:hypothetical protein [bacterium]